MSLNYETTLTKLLLSIILAAYVPTVECVSLDRFMAPNMVRSNDNYELNCSYRLEPNEVEGAYISLVKDGEEFYRYTPQSEKMDTHSVRGISKENIDTFVATPGRVRIRNANRDSEGLYMCRIMVEIVGAKSSTSNSRLIVFVGDDQPAGRRTDSLPSMALNKGVNIILLAISVIFALACTDF